VRITASVCSGQSPEDHVFTRGSEPVRDFRGDWWALRTKAGLGKFVKRRDRKRENVASGRAYGSMICGARRHGICGGTVSIKTLSCESEDGRLRAFLGGTISSVKLTSAEVAREDRSWTNAKCA
jgi:hypothetical protein